MRPESGPMQFGDDWTGVFIRGDDAAYYTNMLRYAIEHCPSIGGTTLVALKGLLTVLASHDETMAQVSVQELKPFIACMKKV